MKCKYCEKETRYDKLTVFGWEENNNISLFFYDKKTVIEKITLPKKELLILPNAPKIKLIKP